MAATVVVLIPRGTTRMAATIHRVAMMLPARTVTMVAVMEATVEAAEMVAAAVMVVEVVEGAAVVAAEAAAVVVAEAAKAVG